MRFQVNDQTGVQIVRGSRHLNSNGGVLGLNIYDLVGAIGILILVSEGLRPIRFEILAVPVAVGSLFALIPLRLRFRRKMIRDTLLYWLRPKVLYDPKSRTR